MLRPPVSFDPANGLLRAAHFQVAYATPDIDTACDILRAAHGVEQFRRLEGPLAAGGEIRVELAWIGGIMIELLTARGPGSALYMDRVQSGAPMTLHHLGYLLDGPQWDALMARVAAQGHTMPHVSHNAGFMKSCFVDAPGLGHYLEYLCPEPAGLSFFESVPGC